MTVELWRACLARFATYGSPNERLMAGLLLRLSGIDDPRVVRVFDKYASEILEAAP